MRLLATRDKLSRVETWFNVIVKEYKDGRNRETPSQDNKRNPTAPGLGSFMFLVSS